MDGRKSKIETEGQTNQKGQRERDRRTGTPKGRERVRLRDRHTKKDRESDTKGQSRQKGQTE